MAAAHPSVSETDDADPRRVESRSDLRVRFQHAGGSTRPDVRKPEFQISRLRQTRLTNARPTAVAPRSRHGLARARHLAAGRGDRAPRSGCDGGGALDGRLPRTSASPGGFAPRGGRPRASTAQVTEPGPAPWAPP